MNRREFIAGLGGTAAWPLTARAQQPALPVIGYLSSASMSSVSAYTLKAFGEGLAQIGYVEGSNVNILYRWADYQYDRLPELAADLVRRNPAVLVTTAGTSSARAAKAATTTIPIVFQLGGDPVAIGLVASLNRPGGNVTGAVFLTNTLMTKRLEILHEAVPTAATIAYLVNPNDYDDGRIANVEAAAHTLGIRLVIQHARSPSEIDAAFVTFAEQRIGALLTDPDPMYNSQRSQFAALAARHAIPAIYHTREMVEAGGLMSYGASAADAYRLAGAYAGRILRGEKPADLPVQQSSKVEFTVNLKAASALGLTVPPSVLVRADEVIE